MTKIIKNLFFLTLILQACIPYNESIKNLPAVSTPTESFLTSLPTNTNIATPTKEETSCIELISDDKNIKRNGILILDPKSDKSYNFLDLNTMAISKIPEQTGNVYRPILSPDGKYMIGEVCESECAYVIRDINQIVNRIPSQKDWILTEWIDNENILILTIVEPNEVLILNIFTGNTQTIDLNLNNPFTIFRTGDEKLIPVSLDRSLSKILFYDEYFGGRLVLWDSTEEKEIISLPYNVNVSARFDAFSWSHDRQVYLVTAPDNNNNVKNTLFSINLNGTLARLTYFDQDYAFANIAYPVWSQDDRFIAFWLRISSIDNINPDELPQYLTIIDTLKSEINIYCQTSGYFSAGRVFWNEFSNQIIANTKTEEGIIKPILIDLVHLTKSEIDTNNSSVKGWMMP